MPDFGAAERRMLSYYKRGVELFYKGSMYIGEEADKPTCSFGEPKTDIYVLPLTQIKYDPYIARRLPSVLAIFMPFSCRCTCGTRAFFVFRDP